MIQIRRNCFETNSSSTHCLAVPEKNNIDEGAIKGKEELPAPEVTDEEPIEDSEEDDFEDEENFDEEPTNEDLEELEEDLEGDEL